MREHLEDLPAPPADEQPAAPESADADLRKRIDFWFFNHFHQSAIVTQPHVFRLARAAKEDLLKLLGIE